MTAADLAAYIGALAWFPQIVSWIKSAMVTLKLRVIPAESLFVTFDNEGPAVTITAAFSADRKDALIEDMALTTTHINGERRGLKWRLLSEAQSQLQFQVGGAPVMEMNKTLVATALKVTTDAVSDRTIRFVDFEFADRVDHLIRRLSELKQRLKGHESESHVRTSKEFDQLREALLDDLYWKEGQYELVMALKEVRRRQPYRERFRFSLSKSDIEQVRSNKAHLESFLDRLVSPIAPASEEPQWTWASAKIEKA